MQVYLDREALLSSGALTSKRWSGTGDNRCEIDVLTIDGAKVDDHGGAVTLYLGDLLTDVPKTFENFVSGVSHYDNFGDGLIPNRRLGQYRLGSAVAELMVVGSGRDTHYHVKIKAKNLADLRELYTLIRQGQIWPAIDYETEQVPPPYRHLRDLVSEMWKLVRRDVRNRLFRIRERVLG
jgi:hypothetical protein